MPGIGLRTAARILLEVGDGIAFPLPGTSPRACLANETEPLDPQTPPRLRGFRPGCTLSSWSDHRACPGAEQRQDRGDGGTSD